MAIMDSRYLHDHLARDLRRKMVFMGGPRQSGKTTLARHIMKDWTYPAGHGGQYFNWDLDEDRARIIKKIWGEQDDVVIFDELHKFRRWKNWIKGIYDTEGPKRHFLVTGSARLDVYRRGGDSLMGRYHYWRLHPFTLSELPKRMTARDAFQRLLSVGGFPEPFLDGGERAARRWRRERMDRVLRDDVRDLESLRDISTLNLLVDALRTRVGGLVVINNIATDLQVAPQTIARWLEILERMYLVFIVRPLTKSIPRAIQKPPKGYFFDNADVQGDEGVRFENFVATTLLKRLHFLEDRDGYRYTLHYIRDKEGREVDFAIVKDGCVEELIEAKWNDTGIAQPLVYYAERLRPTRATQIVATLKRGYSKAKLRVETPFESLAKPL